MEEIENCPNCNSMNVTAKPGYISKCLECGHDWRN